MLDINDVKNLEKESLEERIEKSRLKEIDNLEYYDRQRKCIFEDIEKGRISAEKRFPNVLKEIENCIADAIKRQLRSFRYYCSGSGEWDLHFTKIMLVQALPLQGLICRFNDDIKYLDISW